MRQSFLSIDGGNSRLKVTLFSPDGSVKVAFFASDDVEGVSEYAERNDVNEAGMAAVGHVDARLAETLRNQLGGDFLLVTPATPVPLRIRYEVPALLGLDRKATAVAAAVLYPGETVLVIDSGTALTIDLVGIGLDGSPSFLGGNISPGLRMRLKSLHDHTARLPLVDVDRMATMPFFGESTPGAIAAGAAGGLLDEIALAAWRGGEAGASRILLTGGDSGWIMRHLPQRLLPGSPRVEHNPHLLALGIRAIYDYQANT